MKMKWLISGFAAMLLISTAACSAVAKQIAVDASATGKQVEIASGGTLTVTLGSNATTGYSWQLTDISDSSVLEKTNNNYVTPTSTLMGAGGKEVWTFTALKAGRTMLTMEYDQPWTGGQKNAQSFNLTVVVK
jgi:inhibitor of cysteine peptidase